MAFTITLQLLLLPFGIHFLPGFLELKVTDVTRLPYHRNLIYKQPLKFIDWCGELYTLQILGKLPLYIQDLFIMVSAVYWAYAEVEGVLTKIPDIILLDFLCCNMHKVYVT